MFSVGQQVICIADRWSPGNHKGAPKKGRRYTIREVQIYMGKQGLKLCEITNAPPAWFSETLFCASGFRPIVARETDISIFKKMLTPTRPEVIDRLARDLVHDIRELVKGRG